MSTDTDPAVTVGRIEFAPDPNPRQEREGWSSGQVTADERYIGINYFKPAFAPLTSEQMAEIMGKVADHVAPQPAQPSTQWSPTDEIIHVSKKIVTSAPAIDLRDQFALQAMAVMSGMTPKLHAIAAYDLADAMMAERAKRAEAAS